MRRKFSAPTLRYHPPMSLRLRLLRLLAAGLALSPALSAQTLVTAVAAGTVRATENSRPVSGVRIEPRPDGTVWFLVPANDRIVQLQSDGLTLKQWQIRDDKNLGANPVDFEIDGNFVWFIENGESLIDAGKSVVARLDTSNGQLREWILPGSRPAGFYRAPDGKIWVPQTNGRLQSLDPATLDVVDYRSPKTFAYSDVVPGPDGTIFMSDFGNNRIVRYKPGASTETSWTFFDPLAGRLDPSQIQFDDQGRLWMSELSGARMDRFDPATGVIFAFAGFVLPIHFDLFGGKVYVAEAPGSNGRVVVLDPQLAASSFATIVPETLDVGASPNKVKALIRDTTITPVTFTTTADAIAEADLKITTVSPGVLRTEFPSVNGYGIAVSGGTVWVGSEGKLARVLLQTIGAPADLTVPAAAEFGVSPGERIKSEITLYNRGSDPISGDVLYLFSPAYFPSRTTFTVAPGETLLLPDPFNDVSSNIALLLGPVRIRVSSGSAADLSASVRTARFREDGSSFGFALPAVSGAEVLGQGASRLLFTGARAEEASVFGLYSPAGVDATATLVAPDGTVRGTRRFTLAPNTALEFNPAASAFGVAAEPGDVIRLSVASGGLQAYVNVLDLQSRDVASSPPVAATRDAVIANLGTLVGAGEVSYVSDLFLSNADTTAPARVTVTLVPVGAGQAPAGASVTLPPGASLAIADLLPTLFSVSAGQGAVLVASDAPVFVAYRVAARRPEGDFATFAAAADGSAAIPGGGSATAFGVPQTATRRTHLLLYNRGAAGTVTVVGYGVAGAEIGRLSVDLASGEAARINSVMEQLGATDQRTGHIVVQPSDGMTLFAETAELDGGTGDAEFATLRPF